MAADDRPSPLKATDVFIAAVLAAVGGSIAFVIMRLLAAPARGDDQIGAVLLLVLLATVYALPFVAGGLLVFGVPAAYALQRHHKALWLWPVSIVAGIAVAYLAVFAVASVLSEELAFDGVPLPFLGYGAAAGLALCFMAKRRLARSGPDGVSSP